MIQLEGVLCVLLGWVGKCAAAFFLENLCSCYFPFLLSARFYYTVKSPRICRLLIAPQRNRSSDSRTAPEDRDKLPLPGCIYCIVALPWLLCEGILLLLLLALAAAGGGTTEAPIAGTLAGLCETLYGNEAFLVFLTGMPVLYLLDYSIGLRRWQKRGMM